MNELRRVRVRTLWWSVLPATVVFLIPWLLHRLSHAPVTHGWGVRQWLGVWLIANGLGLSAWCVNLFNVEGQGTPLPLDPPKRFVAKGPYRYVRNPMMLGAFLALGGEAVLCHSAALVLYLLALIVLAHLFVVRWEERDLMRRFGPLYQDYTQQVPRWIPRPKPWRGPPSCPP